MPFMMNMRQLSSHYLTLMMGRLCYCTSESALTDIVCHTMNRHSGARSSLQKGAGHLCKLQHFQYSSIGRLPVISLENSSCLYDSGVCKSTQTTESRPQPASTPLRIDRMDWDKRVRVLTAQRMLPRSCNQESTRVS